jgi:transposase
LPEVRLPEQPTWELRQLLSHRRFVGKQRVAVRNTIQGLLNQKLLRCPHENLWGPAGRSWLAAQSFTSTERGILARQLALHEVIVEQMNEIDAQIKAAASQRVDAKLLMTIPGVSALVAMGLLSAIGDIDRFSSPGQLASYLGLVPRVHQSADRCYHGSITKAGRSHARWLAVEAAQSIALSSAPLAATYHRVRRKKGHNVAVVAVARKLAVLVWHLLRTGEPYRYAPAAWTRKKLRRLTPGAKPAARGKVPTTLEAVYAEAGLPRLSEPKEAERRAAAVNRRTITRLRKSTEREHGAETEARA